MQSNTVFDGFLSLAATPKIQAAYYADELKALQDDPVIASVLNDLQVNAPSEPTLLMHITNWFNERRDARSDRLSHGMMNVVILMDMLFLTKPRKSRAWRPPLDCIRGLPPRWEFLPIELAPLIESSTFLATVSYECSDQFREAARQFISSDDLQRCEEWGRVLKSFGFERASAWRRRALGAYRSESMQLFRLIAVLDALGIDYY